MSEQKKKIIIIDDVELNRAILSEAFSKKYDVIEANDGSEGLNKIYENENENERYSRREWILPFLKLPTNNVPIINRKIRLFPKKCG